MFRQTHSSDNRKFCLYIRITCSGNKKFRVCASESGKPHSKYSDRVIKIEGERVVHMSFPVSPKELVIEIADMANLQANDFKVQLIEGPLQTYNIYLDEQAKSFVKLAQDFSQICGYQPATEMGRMFQNNSGEFRIKFFDVIRSRGQVISTPARIGHKTGIIEVAKAKFDNYTVAMRMIILLHEFSHVYRNPNIGLPIDDEIGADINALYIYLGLGYSKVDAICVFANVFLKAQTDGNIERMRKIYNYIQRFENEEFTYKN